MPDRNRPISHLPRPRCDRPETASFAGHRASQTMKHESSTPELRQQLSALVDGELERDQLRFLVRRVPGDVELRGVWQRWHVAGDCLRGQGSAPLRADFVARIALAIDAEPTVSRAYGGQALKWAGGFAVAASVALAALLAVNPQRTPVPDAPVA